MKSARALELAEGLRLSAARVIVPEGVVIHCPQVNFRLHKRAVVLGREGLFLLGTPMLRRGTEVVIDMRVDGEETRLRALVGKSLEGVGILFHFIEPKPSLDTGLQQLERVLARISGSRGETNRRPRSGYRPQGSALCTKF